MVLQNILVFFWEKTKRLIAEKSCTFENYGFAKDAFFLQRRSIP
jgi:hypothetical protein